MDDQGRNMSNLMSDIADDIADALDLGNVGEVDAAEYEYEIRPLTSAHAHAHAHAAPAHAPTLAPAVVEHDESISLEVPVTANNIGDPSFRKHRALQRTIANPTFRKLQRNTNRLMVDYQNFLSDIDTADAGEGGGAGDVASLFGVDGGDGGNRLPKSNDDFDEENSVVEEAEATTATTTGEGVSMWTRRESQEGERNLAPLHLATIPETDDWSRIGDAGRQDEYDRSVWWRWKRRASRFGVLDRTNCRAGAIISVCAIVLLAAVLSLTGENEPIADDDASAHQGAGGYSSDLYDRPPGLEGDELSDSPVGLDHKSEFDTTTTAKVVDNITSGPPQKAPDPSHMTIALTKKEEAALRNMNPRWYGRKDGYLGTTHEEAQNFCFRVDGGGVRALCLPEAYCPNGSPRAGKVGARPLFLKTKAFPDEQWAPLALNPNSWLLIGTIEGEAGFTCETYDALHDGAQPLWGMTGTDVELKRHVLCCKSGDGSTAEQGQEGL